jgi:hypothetical protein
VHSGGLALILAGSRRDAGEVAQDYDAAMFGRDKRLERKLREEGRRAPAEVLEAEQSGIGITVGNRLSPARRRSSGS